MDLPRLADDLIIEMRWGKHSLGNVYEYLLNAYADANRAKADFIRFLSGDLPRHMLEVAAESILQEQGLEPEAERYNVQVVTIRPSLVVADELQPIPCRG
jgi:hypothetical protein